jgi:8-amino-7-oxononanoate synthase
LESDDIMPDFTSALYLGMQHAKCELRPWPQLTSGVPLALAVPDAQRRLETSLAALVNCDAAALGPSTLHLFWDLFGLLANERSLILVDRGVYPISRVGIERARAQGARVETFPHHDANALALASKRHAGRRILVVSDGFCTGCGARAPVADYLAITAARGGILVLDDTQGLGVLGRTPSTGYPLGKGGGGVLADLPEKSPHLLAISSLAKGFGVPLAALMGSHGWLKRFIAESETRVHCSPPSIAHLHAAAHALSLNQRQGERLRARLVKLIRTFRTWLREFGWHSIGGLFPVQSLIFRAPEGAHRLYRHLMRCDIRTVLRRIRCSGHAAVSFVLHARHTDHDLEIALSHLARFLPNSCPIFMESPNEYPIFGNRMDRTNQCRRLALGIGTR